MSLNQGAKRLEKRMYSHV